MGSGYRVYRDVDFADSINGSVCKGFLRCERQWTPEVGSGYRDIGLWILLPPSMGAFVEDSFNGSVHRGFLQWDLDIGISVVDFVDSINGSVCRRLVNWERQQRIPSVGFGYRDIGLWILRTPSMGAFVKDSFNESVHRRFL